MNDAKINTSISNKKMFVLLVIESLIGCLVCMLTLLSEIDKFGVLGVIAIPMAAFILCFGVYYVTYFLKNKSTNGCK